MQVRGQADLLDYLSLTKYDRANGQCSTRVHRTLRHGRYRVAMDKRAAPRRQVRKVGTIEFGGGAFSCMVRDLSSAGAALDLPSAAGIPDHFVLIVPADGLRFGCHTIWRKETRIGIRFDYVTSARA